MPSDSTHDPIPLWGRKPSGHLRRLAARLLGRPTIFVEDGFLRSVRTGAEGDIGLSHVVDRTGIYYDATRPSDLETLIASGAGETPELLARAEAGIALLRRHRLSKYNAAPWREAAALGIPDGRDAVLIVDQTAGDLSLRYGGADATTFRDMLDAVRREHPRSVIVVKTHPAVSSGHRRGHYPTLAGTSDVVVIREPVNPWALLERCRTVHVATSQLGFEALMAGCAVHCHGLPFYAGWGLTADRQRPSRRGRPASLAAVFAAAYFLYSRYRDPYALERCSFEGTVDHLVRLRDHAAAQRPGTVLVGFDRWKRAPAATFFRPAAGRAVRFRSARSAAAARWLPSAGRVIGWASRVDESFVASCDRAQVPFLWMEDGFLRSVGLGSALVPGASYVLDRQRPHYDARGPSDLEALLAEGVVGSDLRARAAALRQRLVALRLSKYNTGRHEDLRSRLWPAGDRRIVLVAGQVEDDMAILKGAPRTRTNRGLLEAVRVRHPDAFLVYKPHPDVLAGLRRGHVPHDVVAALADLEIADVHASDAIDAVDHVEVMSSLIGFEALLRGRTVTCHGLPFYAGWGLTEDLVPCARRQRRLDLDEIVAGALIRYPHYVDPHTQQPCTPEHLLDRLANDRLHDFHVARRPEAAAVLFAAACVRGWRRLSG